MPKYLILGPEDHNHLPLFWSRERGEWVERDDATLYGEGIWQFPPWELPIGGRGILDIENGLHYTPRWPGEGLRK
jgi:hypothetical protein